MIDVEMESVGLSNIREMEKGATTQYDIEKGAYEKIGPRVKNDSTFEFEIHNSKSAIELNKTEVGLKLRVQKADGTNLEATDHVGLVNYAIASLFNNLEIKLNNKTITHGSSNYAERAIMEVLLSYNEDAVKSWLQAGLYEKDTAGRMDAADPSAGDDVVNHGLKKRSEHTKLSRLLTLRGKLHEDIFHQGRFLPPGVKMELRFSRNSDAYCLMSNVENAAYKIVIEEMALYVRKADMYSEAEQILTGKQRVIPIDRVTMKEFNVTQGGNMFIENALHSGQMPKQLCMAFIDNKGHTGSYKHNPFHWAHADVKKVSLFRDGQIINGLPLSTDFANGDAIDGFWSLSRATNTRFANAGTLIELDDYKKGGYTLWAYDLSPSQSDGQFIDPKQRGSLSLEIEFAKNLTAPLVLCVYLQFDSEIVINEVGAVTTMYD